VAQRIVRAKRALAAARVPFELPPPGERAARMASVLEVIYLIFNEGYAATTGADWMRPALAEEALRLARILAELTPAESEVQGLAALLELQASRMRARVDLLPSMAINRSELQASRMRARVDAQGAPILLLEQDRSCWDRLPIGRGLRALERAAALAAAQGGLGPYALQAAIAACHTRAAAAQDTDWPQIAALYDALAQLAPSPVVALNRAVALGMAFGAAAGPEAADALREEPALREYHLLPAVRGDLLHKLGRVLRARAEFVRAARLTRNARERDLLLARAEACRAVG
jgi:predicted RNA polymerase sigma factor